MGELSAWHWAVVVVVAVLLFGSQRLPDAARSLGRSARILRAELRGDDTTASTARRPAGQHPSAAEHPADPPGRDRPAG